MANIDSVKLPNGNEYNLQDVVTPRSFTNPNLAFNPWFTVNQRGVTSGSFTNGVYLMDRWKADGSGGTFSLTSSGFSFATSSSSTRYIMQYYEGAIFAGETYTISIMFSDGHIESATGVPQAMGQTTIETTQYSGIKFSLADEVAVIRCAAGSTATIKAVKIEKGTTSTLHLDTAPDYTTELLKCQRYFVRIKSDRQYCTIAFAKCESTTSARGLFSLPVEMRAEPTLSFSGTIYVQDGELHNVSAISVKSCSNLSLFVEATTTGIVAQTFAQMLFGTAVSYIDVSAEL